MLFEPIERLGNLLRRIRAVAGLRDQGVIDPFAQGLDGVLASELAGGLLQFAELAVILVL